MPDRCSILRVCPSDPSLISFSPTTSSQAEQPCVSSQPSVTTFFDNIQFSDGHDPSAQNPVPSSSTNATELSRLTRRLKQALRQFPDFPSKGVVFEDILPIFADPSLHEILIRALHLHVLSNFATVKRPDVIVGLEARGFLFGPSLALCLGAAFVPVRKHGKLPGPTLTVSYQKEYGQDSFEMQKDAIKPDQNVLIVDDIIATGGSAAAAGALVKLLLGNVLGYVFIMELDFLKGREKLEGLTCTLLSSQETESELLHE